MASWAKNQITKQLAKFAKNLDPNSLSLKFFKGEGELTNLELDETVLSDLLEFPPWLHLSKVTCNRISTKVPWTSLKSDPIRLMLDNVDVQIVASETAREKADNIPVFTQKANTKPAKYGFSEKVLDGIYLSINTLSVSFTSLGFKASVNISRIIVQSTGPDWRPMKNLRHTRVKDDLIGEVMIFKEIRWSTMRVDADASYKPESKDIPSTPLRLITNNSSVRLVIKKRIADCTMIASKLSIILDDILWVLTRSQILKLSSFVHYLLNLRNSYLPLQHQTALSNEIDAINKSPTLPQGESQNQLFQVYNIHETSIHLRTQRIDLHLCDDTIFMGKATKSAPPSKLSFDESGAALQIAIVKISLDQYPYHVAGTKRASVNSDDEVAFQRKRWSHQLLNNFQGTEGKQWKPPTNNHHLGLRSGRSYPVMYESYVIVSCQNFQIMQVTTVNTVDPKPVLSSEKEALYLPAEMSAFTIDHTTYYYTGGVDLPVPAPNVFVQVNPIQLRYDPLTCIWLNRFAQSVITGLDWTKEFMSAEPGFTEQVNVRVEALMPKVVIPLGSDTSLPHHDERPSSLQIQISQAVISNCRVGSKCSQTDILNDLQDFIGSRIYADMSVFPNERSDSAPYTNAAWLNDYSINHHQLQNLTRRDKQLYSRLKQDNNLPHLIWGFWCDQIWIEFAGVEKACDRPISFVDAFPLRIWLCTSVPYYESPSARPSFSTASSDSVEATEVAAEFNELTDIKFNKMSVVYDANVGVVTNVGEKRPSLSSEKRPPLSSRLHSPGSYSVDSTHSSPGAIQAHSNNKPLNLQINRPGFRHSKSDSKCNGGTLSYTTEDIEAMRNLRTSRSENDLNPSPPLTSNATTKPPDGGVTNCIDSSQQLASDSLCGGPPPPYTDDARSYKNSLGGSYSSLPPAYESIPDDQGGDPINKPVITDFVQYGIDSESAHASDTPAMAVLVHTSKTVQVQLDHFQLLFLLRLGENFVATMEKVDADNERCEVERRTSVLGEFRHSGTEEATEDVGVILSVMIPNVMVDLVLAPCIGIDPVQTYNLTDRIQYEKEKVANENEQLPLVVNSMECLPLISSYEVMNRKQSLTTNVVDEQSSLKLANTIVHTTTNGHPSEIVNEVYSCDTQQNNLYQTPAELRDLTGNVSNEFLGSTEQETYPDPSLAVTEGERAFDMDYSQQQYIYDSPMHEQLMSANEKAIGGANCDGYQPNAVLYCDVNENGMSTYEYKNGGQVASTFDQTLKEVADVGIQVGNSMMNVNLKPKPEDQLISVLRIRIGSLFLGMQSEGTDSVVKISAETLRLNELGNMKYGKLLDPRGLVGIERQQEKRQINMDSLTGSGVLKIRLGTGRYAEQIAPGTSETSFADIRVSALAAALLMSTIDNLQEFGEDESIGPPLPFVMDITHSDISIYDDKPRRYKSAIKFPPSQIVIDQIYLVRDKYGVLSVKEKSDPGNANEPDVGQSENQMNSIGSYSATINSNLIAESITQQVDALIGENSRLLEDLKVVNAKMNGLHSERDSLLKVIDKLQQELVNSNRENDDLHNRVRTLSLSRHQGHYV